MTATRLRPANCVSGDATQVLSQRAKVLGVRGVPGTVTFLHAHKGRRDPVDSVTDEASAPGDRNGNSDPRTDGVVSSSGVGLAPMASEIEAARQLMHHVAAETDAGRGSDKDASMVKWFASEMAERVTSNGLQIFGGAGYTKLYPVEHYWRDARLTKILEGTSEIQLHIVSDHLLGKPAGR